jgi:hypothetical protein
MSVQDRGVDRWAYLIVNGRSARPFWLGYSIFVAAFREAAGIGKKRTEIVAEAWRLVRNLLEQLQAPQIAPKLLESGPSFSDRA